MYSEAVANVVYALALLKVERRELCRTFYTAWSEACQAKLPVFKPQELAISIYALGQLDLEPTEPGDYFFVKWSEACTEQFSLFEPRHLSNAVYGLAQLKMGAHLFGGNFFLRWSEACVEKLSLFDSQHLANALYGLAAQGVHGLSLCDNFFQGIISACFAQLDTFNCQAMCNTLYSLALLESVSAKTNSLELVGALFSRVLPLLQTLQEVHQVVMASVWFGTLMPRSLLRRFDREARAVNRVSQLEQRVANAIACEHMCSHWIEPLLTTVDIFIEQTNTIVQVDGPHHFMRDGQRDASTNFVTQLLVHLGYTVIRVDYREVGRRSDSELREMMSALLKGENKPARRF